MSSSQKGKLRFLVTWQRPGHHFPSGDLISGPLAPRFPMSGPRIPRHGGRGSRPGKRSPCPRAGSPNGRLGGEEGEFWQKLHVSGRGSGPRAPAPARAWQERHAGTWRSRRCKPTGDRALRREDRFNQKPTCPCGLGGNFPAAQTLLAKVNFPAAPSPGVLALPRLPARLELQLERWPRPRRFVLDTRSSLYSRLSMDRSQERSRLPT